MKTVRRRLPNIGIALALTGLAGMFTAGEPSAQTPVFAYSAKFVCGPRTADLDVVRGIYRSKVNIHNPLFAPVQFRKKAVIALPQRSPRGRISPFVPETLLADEAIGVDCVDIRQLFPPPALPAFIEGYIVLYASTPLLDVDTVQTVRKRNGTSADGAIYDATSIDVERVEAKQIPPP
jgi:hypothetical protein